MISYILTAALAVFIIIVYYVVVYDPLVDPFDADADAGADAAQEGAMRDHINPLDDFLLRWLRSGPAYISKQGLGSRKLLSPRARSRLERVLIKVRYARSAQEKLPILVGQWHRSIYIA